MATFSNSGTVTFTNSGLDYNNAATTGAVVLNMLGSSHNNITCNDVTTLYRLIVNKGSDSYYIVSLSSTATGNFLLYGPNNGAAVSSKALYLQMEH